MIFLLTCARQKGIHTHMKQIFFRYMLEDLLRQTFHVPTKQIAKSHKPYGSLWTGKLPIKVIVEVIIKN